MPKAKRVESSHLHLNLTAMLDVVFNLIFFFICITNFSSGELPPMEVPKPDHSKAALIEERKKIILNIIPEEGGWDQAEAVKVGAELVHPGEERRITELLKKEHDIDAEIEIDLRVDRRIQFRYVQPIMNAITRAGIEKINLVADTEKK
jgi:biopolymer transport protein TolR